MTTTKSHWLMIMIALPLAFVVGCGGDPNDCEGDECDGTVDTDTGNDTCSDCPDGTDDFEATIHMVTPDGYTGDFYVDGDLFHEGTDECWWDATETGEFLVELELGSNYVALGKYVDLTEDGQLEEVTWGDGEYGLMPCGDYSGDVFTNVEVCTDWSGGKIVIEGNPIPPTVVTGNTFEVNEDAFYMTGVIAEDLSWIEIYRDYDGEVHEDTVYLN